MTVSVTGSGTDKGSSLPHVTAAELDRRVPMGRAVEAVGEALRLLVDGDFDQPQRAVMNDATVLVMAATRISTGDAVVKTVTVRLGATDGEQAINGTLLWIDGETGQGAFTVDGAQVTALRTGAVSGVATSLLAVPDARRLTVVGAGRQAWTQVSAVSAVRPITSITVTSRTEQRARSFAAAVAADRPGVSVQVVDDPDEAVADADVICAATSASTPVFAAESPPSWAHVNAVGAYQTSMAELPTELMTSASLVAVDDREACLAESGEVTAAVAAGVPLAALHPLGALVARPPAREGRTVFKSVGCAALDWAVGDLLATELLAHRRRTPLTTHDGRQV